MIIHKLIVQIRMDSEGWESPNFTNLSLGYYDNIELLQKEIPKSCQKLLDMQFPEIEYNIFNIFSRDINLNCESNEFDNYTFFDKSGNWVSNFIEDEIRKDVTKFKKGDIVTFINDGDIPLSEIGIISTIPNKNCNEYTILTGNTLGSHSHVIGEFLHSNNTLSDEAVSILTDRLVKIGY